MYYLKLRLIFGDQWDNPPRREAIIQQLCSIKYMRYIIVPHDAIVAYTEKILFKESMRVFNEHAIRLLVDNEINY